MTFEDEVREHLNRLAADREEALLEAYREAHPAPAEPDSNYCGECGRLRVTGCACGLSFRDKVRTVQVDKTSLRVRDTGA